MTPSNGKQIMKVRNESKHLKYEAYVMVLLNMAAPTRLTRWPRYWEMSVRQTGRTLQAIGRSAKGKMKSLLLSRTIISINNSNKGRLIRRYRPHVGFRLDNHCVDSR